MSFVRFFALGARHRQLPGGGKVCRALSQSAQPQRHPSLSDSVHQGGLCGADDGEKIFCHPPPLLAKTHVRVRIVERRGLPFLLRRWKRRKGLLVGVAAFLLLLFLSGQFVWEIQINGNQTVTDDEILQSLEEMGLSRGSWKESLDVQKMAILLRQQYEQIGWAAINLMGGVAEVDISERQEGEEIVESNEPCNVVAARGGQIVAHGGV